MIGTKGLFAINPRWDFGWDVLVQSDKNFSQHLRHRRLQRARAPVEVYLTGLNGRNYFDLRAMHFQVQEDTLDSKSRGAQRRAALGAADARLFLYARTSRWPGAS